MPDFSLLGGPLHRAGVRLGLVRGTNTVALGIAIGAFLWIVLIALAFADGVAGQLFTLSKIGGHVRLLVVIPLFFYAECLVDPRFGTFVRTIVRSGVVPAGQLPALQSAITRLTRWANSWAPDAIGFVAAIVMSLTASQLHLAGATAALDASQAGGMTMAGWWYWVVCLTCFRLLMLRWLWRLGVWSFFLWRVSRLKLNLIPTHPDGVAGLGYLEVVHAHFAPLVCAISIVQSAALVEELSAGLTTFEGTLPAVALVLVVVAVLFVGPLFVFFTRLWACQVKGLSDYMEFASDYVGAFDKKWINSGAPEGEALLGTPDLQSLADLNNSMSVVRGMRLVPGSVRLLMGLGVAALWPMLPLLLFKYPLSELVQKFVARLTGL